MRRTPTRTQPGTSAVAHVHVHVHVAPHPTHRTGSGQSAKPQPFFRCPHKHRPDPGALALQLALGTGLHMRLQRAHLRRTKMGASSQPMPSRTDVRAPSPKALQRRIGVSNGRRAAQALHEALVLRSQACDCDCDWLGACCASDPQGKAICCRTGLPVLMSTEHGVLRTHGGRQLQASQTPHADTGSKSAMTHDELRRTPSHDGWRPCPALPFCVSCLFWCCRRGSGHTCGENGLLLADEDADGRR
ncbi:hypothetical protein DENSPDRAFT_581482 [Dentipellis sp. KUC8613]|nr:hypothetical protein DENSPDRAFT_581482 [Dentipellis sp. KUC8613]